MTPELGRSGVSVERGYVPYWHDLAHRKAEDIEREGIRLLLNHTARVIDPLDKAVTVLDGTGRSRQLSYDKLVIGTGAVPARGSEDLRPGGGSHGLARR